MNELMILKIVYFLLFYRTCLAASTTCRHNMTAINDSILILSDDLVDANTAQGKCSLLGGNLAMTDDPQINENLNQIMIDKYTKGLQRIWIFYDNRNPEVTRFSLNQSEIGHWKSTKGLGLLWYIDLFENKSETHSEIVSFCNAPLDGSKRKWVAMRGRYCGYAGWYFQFKYFGRNNSKPGYKQIHLYTSPGQWSTLIRSLNETYKTFNHYEGSFFVPDINVVIGARYNTSLNAWYWSDGSPANFTTSNITTCQQRALHYGIGWEQSSVKCGGEPAYYACQYKLVASVTSFPCNITTVKVGWNGLDNFLIKYGLDAQVEVRVHETNQSLLLPYFVKYMNITDLLGASQYTIKVTAFMSGCIVANISTSITVATSAELNPECFMSYDATYKIGSSGAFSLSSTNPIASTSFESVKSSTTPGNKDFTFVAGIVIGTLIIAVVCCIAIWKFRQHKANDGEHKPSANVDLKKREVAENQHYETINDDPPYMNVGQPAVEGAYEL